MLKIDAIVLVLGLASNFHGRLFYTIVGHYLRNAFRNKV